MPQQIKLYVSDASRKSSVRLLEEAISELPTQQFEVAVINVKDQPEHAEKDNIVATPTLIKLEANGENGKRLIGFHSVSLLKHFLMGIHSIFPEP